MPEPKRLLVAGDLHGNVEQLLYVGQMALDHECDGIFQVGDFGYFEHVEGGPEFLEVVSQVAVENDLPVFWIDGNHENHDMLHEKYGDEQTAEGFWVIRPGVYYVPRGTRWEWHGVKMMGFGGAISIDRRERLKRETEEWMDARGRMQPPTGHRSQWWPGEDITDAEIAKALVDPTPLDILFTHDKPRSSKPEWNRKDIPFLLPVQDKIQTLVDSLKPKLLVHGHLHWRYEDNIRAGDDHVTHVLGLNCDGSNRQSWEVLQLV